MRTVPADTHNKLIENFGINADQIRQLLINSANAAFASEELKQKLIDKINASF